MSSDLTRRRIHPAFAGRATMALSIAVLVTGSAWAQKSTSDVGNWPAGHPLDQAFLCGESAVAPDGYVDRYNKAAVDMLALQRKRRGIAVSEREVGEIILRIACPSKDPAPERTSPPAVTR